MKASTCVAIGLAPAIALLLTTNALTAGLAAEAKPGRETSANELLARARTLLGDDAHVVFTIRYPSYDHWYATFGYWVYDTDKMCYGRAGSRLVVLNLDTLQQNVLLDDPAGSFRDPHVHYDGRTILFSWRKGGTRYYNLYEIQSDGTGLRQITEGPFDDIEPIYLPTDDIVFISSRCNRWVPCWMTQVGILYRCNRRGGNMQALSSNVEHENTPWMLPDGRVLYMRWEYTSRHVNYFHHLWTMNPDGSGAMVYHGNTYDPETKYKKGQVMLGAKPVPGTRDVVFIASPGHGDKEHRGRLALVNPEPGPDDPQAVRYIPNPPGGKMDWKMRDPYPLTPDLFLAAREGELLLVDRQGHSQALLACPEFTPFDDDNEEVFYDPDAEGHMARRFHREGCVYYRPSLKRATIKQMMEEGVVTPASRTWAAGSPIKLEVITREGFVPCWFCREGPWINEPRPIRPRPREPVIPDRIDRRVTTGRMVLQNVAHGRKMSGIEPGEIKSLLVLEEMPQPYSHNDYQGKTRALTVRRVLGTVPVEADGSAYFEVPAGRSLYFVALDEHERSVKVMQSFVSVMPGETIGCVGCHEYRTETPAPSPMPLALRRAPRRPRLRRGMPDIFHFPRDIQPILDRHCVKCHGYSQPPAAGVLLSGDRGCANYTQSYCSMFAWKQIKWDGPGLGNNPPRTLGTAASPLMDKIDGSHHDVKLSPEEQRTIRLWIDADAHFAGTSAWGGMSWVKKYALGLLPFKQWPKSARRALKTPYEPSVTMEILKRRCSQCHCRGGVASLPSRGRFSAAQVFNLTRPEKSKVLQAPLAHGAGGWDVCKPVLKKAARGAPPMVDTNAPPVWADTSDPDYQALLAEIRTVKEAFDKETTADMPNYRPHPQYVREMKRYGILPESFDLSRDPIDVFETDRKYWQSFWPVAERYGSE